MTKQEAVQLFKRDFMPDIKRHYERDGKPDYVARSETWNNYTDFLCKDGQITEHQYDTWVQPAICCPYERKKHND
jgi:hypothetical protein